jgi:V/A-type H+-transporting ATPase subunit D
LRDVRDEATDKWGAKVTRVELQRIEPPSDVTKAIYRQMKATRDALIPFLYKIGNTVNFCRPQSFDIDCFRAKIRRMRLAVSATRMELMRLRRRLVIARRGHKLLKDKQQELMRLLLELVEEIRLHRQRVQMESRALLVRFALVRSAYDPRFLNEAVMLPSREVKIEIGTKSIMNIRVPVFTKSVAGRVRCYGFATTSGELDLALISFDRLLDSLLVLAEKEKALEILAGELERTRRRVNALEFVLIPSIEDAVRQIAFRLAEAERQNLTRLMRIKEIVRGEEGRE